MTIVVSNRDLKSPEPFIFIISDPTLAHPSPTLGPHASSVRNLSAPTLARPSPTLGYPRVCGLSSPIQFCAFKIIEVGKGPDPAVGG
jgi:hypothetical protein